MNEKTIEGIPDHLEDAMIVIAIYNKGHIMAFSEDTALALILPDERTDKPILDVRCRLDFIYYFAKLLGIPMKFTGLNDNGNVKTQVDAPAL